MQNEWMQFDGAFAESASENTQGYSLEVEEAMLMTANEYLQHCAKDEALEAANDGDADVLVLKMNITNDGNRDGYMSALTWRVVPPAGNDAYCIDWELFVHGEPAMEEAMGIFGIKPNTTRTLYVPFCKQKLGVDYTYLETPADGTSRFSVEEGTYELVFTSTPVKHVIRLEAQHALSE